MKTHPLDWFNSQNILYCHRSLFDRAMDFIAVSTLHCSLHHHRTLQSANRCMALLRHCVTCRIHAAAFDDDFISLFTTRVLHESWSISQSPIWWEDVLCDGVALLKPINSLNITVQLLANGTLLFTLASGIVLYQSESPLLRGTDPSGTD